MSDSDHLPETPIELAPYVLAVLERDGFFEKLDEVFCPQNPFSHGVACGHSFEHSIRILTGLGMDLEDKDEVLSVLRCLGACCDCEVLHNVVEQSRLKSSYWKSRGLRATGH